MIYCPLYEMVLTQFNKYILLNKTDMNAPYIYIKGDTQIIYVTFLKLNFTDHMKAKTEFNRRQRKQTY